jgi:hypothetical protein
MRIFSAFYLLGVVSADQCRTLCDAKLTKVQCDSAATYCKNGGTCHGIFWSSSAKTEICITGKPDCLANNNLPITCTEAATQSASVEEEGINLTAFAMRCGTSVVPPFVTKGCRCCKKGPSGQK